MTNNSDLDPEKPSEYEFTEQEIFICECGSLEHTYALWFDDEYKEIHFSPHLITHDGLFKRIKTAIKYIFGYRSRYGEFDSMIIRHNDLDKIIEYLGKCKS